MTEARPGRTTHNTTADGTIRDWLVSEVWSAPCEDLDRFLDTDGDPWGERGRWVLTNGPDVAELKQQLAAAHRLARGVVLPDAVEGRAFTWEAHGAAVDSTWRRVHTGWDGLVDWSAFCFTPQYRTALAATSVEVDQAEWRTLEVHTTGPFVLWCNGREVLACGDVSYMEPLAHSVRLRIPSGRSTLHLATWQVAFRECRQVARVRVRGLPVRVVIDSPGADETASRWGEQILAEVGSPVWGHESSTGTLLAPAGVALRVRVDGADWQPVQADAQGRAEYRFVDPASDEAGLNILQPSGLRTVELGIDDPRIPVTRTFQVASLPMDSREHSRGEPPQWRQEVLEHVADPPARSQRGIAGVLAQHHLDGRAPVRHQDLTPALTLVDSRGDCADFEILALLQAWHRLPAESWEPGLRDAVAKAIIGMKYWITQPGLDAMCYFTENHQLVWHVAQHLAGAAFPEATFTVDGRLGSEHADEGRRRSAAWIQRKLGGGFSEFDSNAYLAIDSYALASLIEFTDDDNLGLAATTLLDKTLLSLACNSWRGIHGAAHGRSYVPTLRTARLEETSPILRLIAGVGTLNDAVLPVTALALSTRYRIPDTIRRIAASEPGEWWGRQVYQGELAFERDLLQRPYRSDLRVWRTPEVMLSSVTDYRAGLPGLQEHIWGATLGRECQVFMTHPANSDTSGSARPNAWVGHRVLPRVHQHRNVLLGLQRFTPTDPVATTHLWLPRHQFDELSQVGDWLCARRGDGYVAVAAPGGFRERHAGETAHQEWWPRRDGSRWVATVGRRSTDGEFGDWVERLLGSAPQWDAPSADGLAVAWQVPGGPHLHLSFEGAFLVDGVPADTSDGRYSPALHMDNPALRMEFGQPQATATWQGTELRLDVETALHAARRAAG